MSLIFDTAIEFSRIANPDQLTTGLALLILGTLGIFGWSGIKLRSLLTMVVWMFQVMAFVFAITVGTPFRLFWIVTMFNAVVLSVSVVVFTTYGEQM